VLIKGDGKPSPFFFIFKKLTLLIVLVEKILTIYGFELTYSAFTGNNLLGLLTESGEITFPKRYLRPRRNAITVTDPLL
jgi:hypothetical protein